MYCIALDLPELVPKFEIFEKPRFNGIFHKPTHPGGLEKRTNLGEKNSSGSLAGNKTAVTF